MKTRSDETVALLCAAALFVLVAWPLLLVEVPPYQDVPNHLAVSTVIAHPADYPDLVFNGFFKTNAALYAWEHFVGRAVGPLLAVRLFAALALALSAVSYTRLLLVARGRSELLVGCLFLAPMIHSFAVCLGLLDFTLGLGVAMLLLAEIIRQRRAQTAAGAARIALLSALAWWAHLVPFALVHVIVLVDLVAVAIRSRAEARDAFVRSVLPMAPGTLLAAWSVLGQLLLPSSVRVASYASIWLAPWDLIINLWVQWLLPFTPRSAASIVPCVVLAVIAWRRRRDAVPLFGPATFFALAALYAFVPYVMSFWAYANTRVEPFLWTAALLRVPARLPKWLVAALACATLAYSVSLGVDYVRLDRDRKEIVSGIPSVPERASLLPLVFETKGASVNTRPLSHAWGYYVLAKRTATPGFFATSRMLGVTYREAPDPELEGVALEHFVGLMRDPTWTCDTFAAAGVHVGDCEAIWRENWRAFWRHVEPKFDWLLVWDVPPAAASVIPPEYRDVFVNGRLRIEHRVGGVTP